MVEWFIALVLKTKKVNSFQGSNPCLSKKILISILSFKKIFLFRKIIKLIISNFYNFHIDLIDFSYINSNSFCEKEIFFILKFIKKFLNLKYEIHIMTKFNIKKKIKKFFHLENVFFKKYLVIGDNFCWNYIKNLKTKILIMSVMPGFGNQLFLKKTKLIFLKKKNIDGGVKRKIFYIIKNYLNKIIIGTDIINVYNLKTFFLYNFINNEYKN